MSKTSVTPEVFVKEWQKAATKDEFCAKMGLTKTAAGSRAVLYRKNGVELKKFTRGATGHLIDFAALQTIATEHAPEGEEKNGKKGKKKKN